MAEGSWAAHYVGKINLNTFLLCSYGNGSASTPDSMINAQNKSLSQHLVWTGGQLG